MRTIGVWLEEQRVGAITEAAGRMSFAYDDGWNAFPISASLPFGGNFDADAGHNFFANLLPEGPVRAAVCRRLGISVGNDFELLRAIGGECAGALQISDAPDATGSYERISDAELADLNRNAGAASTFAARRGIRLSLAGAQDKLPVYVESGNIHIPVGNAPSSHILKLENRDFKHLPDNELLTSAVARQLGLDVAETEGHTLDDGARLLLVTRYDRVVDSSDELVRLHQEDLCQALGLSPHTKYEDEGGPSFPHCLDVVRNLSCEPMADTRSLLRWQVFNLLIGNSDGHAKNLSLLYRPQGARLAPAYNLVCTRSYTQLARHLALSIGGERDPGQIRAKHWRALAESVEVGWRWLRDTVEEMSDAVEPATRRAIELVGESPAAERILHVVREQARRTRALL